MDTGGWLEIIEGLAKSTGMLSRFSPLRRFTVQAFLKTLTPSQLKVTPGSWFLQSLRKAGLGVRTQWFYRQWGYVRDSQAAFDRQAETAFDDVLRIEDLPLAPFNASSEYTYQVTMEVQGYTEDSPTDERDTDEWGIQPYYFSSDELMSPEQTVAAFEVKFRSAGMKDVTAKWETLTFEKAYQRGPKI